MLYYNYYVLRPDSMNADSIYSAIWYCKSGVNSDRGYDALNSKNYSVILSCLGDVAYSVYLGSKLHFTFLDGSFDVDILGAF